MTRAVLATVPADLTSAADTLRALAPRWTMWTASTLLYTARPLRVAELLDRLPFVAASTMSLRLAHLQDFGVIERPDNQRAPIRLTDHGEALSPLFTALSVWAGKHVDIGTTANTERVEKALHRLTLNDTTSVLQLLTQQGPMRVVRIAQQIGQSEVVTGSRLRRMQDDGLIDRTGPRRDAPYALTRAALDLPPVYTAAHQWTHRQADQTHPTQPAARLSSPALSASHGRGPVPGVRFSDLASAPAASYAAGASRPGTVRR